MEIKVNIFLVLITKTWERGSMVPCILILDTTRRTLVTFTPQLIHHSEKTPARGLYRIAWDAGWASEPVWAF